MIGHDFHFENIHQMRLRRNFVHAHDFFDAALVFIPCTARGSLGIARFLSPIANYRYYCPTGQLSLTSNVAAVTFSKYVENL